MNEEGYIGAVPNQPLIINSNNRKMLDRAEILATALAFTSSGWLTEPSKLLGTKLLKKLVGSPQPQENK